MNRDPVGASRRRHIIARLEIKVPVRASANRANHKVLGATNEESIPRHGPVCRRCDTAERDGLVGRAGRHVNVQVLLGSVGHDESYCRSIDEISR